MTNTYYKPTGQGNAYAEDSANFTSIKVPLKPATPPPNNKPKPKDK